MQSSYRYILIFAMHFACVQQVLWAQAGGVSKTDESVLKHARELRAQNRLQPAAELLERYLSSHPGDPSALTLLAEISLDAGNQVKAQELLAQALHADPNTREANLEAGRLLLAEHHYPEAMDRFETVLQRTPHDSTVQNLELEAVTNLAAGAAQSGNPEGALKAFQHARSYMPDNSRLLMEFGLQALELKHFSEAEEALASARHLNPSDPDIVYASARLQLEEQHMPQAEADLRSYLAARPNDASAHYGLGRILAMEQKDDAARAEFERCIQLQPVQTESYYQLGQLDLNAGKDADAEKLFLRVIGRDPNHSGALVGLGQIAFREKNYPQAAEYLDRAVKAAPDFGPAHYYRGLVLARLGKKQEAEQELKTATQLGEAAAQPVQTGKPSGSPQ